LSLEFRVYYGSEMSPLEVSDPLNVVGDDELPSNLFEDTDEHLA